MNTLPVRFLDRGLHRVMFDAIPIPMFVVDQDVSILEYNAAAARFLGDNRKAVLRRRGGEVLHCVHALENPNGCGRARACPACVIRNSVTAASQGNPVLRQPTELQVVSKGKATKVDLRVSTNPFKYHEHSFVLLMLEGLEQIQAGQSSAVR